MEYKNQCKDYSELFCALYYILLIAWNVYMTHTTLDCYLHREYTKGKSSHMHEEKTIFNKRFKVKYSKPDVHVIWQDIL